MRAAGLNPKNPFQGDGNLPNQDTTDLVAAAVAILQTGTVCLLTVEHQLKLAQLRMGLITAATLSNDHSEDGKLQKLQDRILHQHAPTRAAQEDLYHHLVTFVLLRGGLGTATESCLAREVRSALESVLPLAELPTLLQLSPAARLEQLEAVALIATGIQLYNKLAGKGGSAIRDRQFSLFLFAEHVAVILTVSYREIQYAQG